MEHFKAPILFANPGVRYTQCCECGKIMQLGSFNQAGDHLCCVQCPTNLLLTEMTMVEWDEYQQLHPLAIRTIKPSASPMWGAGSCSGHDGTDAYIGCTCDACNTWRQSELNRYPADFFKEKNSTITAEFKKPFAQITPISFVSGSFKIDSGEVIEPLHKRQGCIKDGKLTSERCSKEADAAQKLFVYFGASAKTLIKNAEHGCSFERAQIQQGRFLLIPSDAPVSLSSPLAIQMLMHFHASPTLFIDQPLVLWPHAQREIVKGFKTKGLIIDGHVADSYRTTERGAVLVTALKAVLKKGIDRV